MLKLLKPLIIITVFSLSFAHANALSEDSAALPAVAQEKKVSEKTATHYGMVDEATVSSFELMGRIVIYLALLAAIGAVILHFFRQGKFMKGVRTQGKVLKVSETHMLGNKQFLVVVEYGQNKILLGVGPGMINRLCFLDDPKKNLPLGNENQ